MRSLSFAAGTVCLALLFCACSLRYGAPPAADVPKDSPSAGISFESVMLPVRDDPTISFSVMFRVGSASDPAGKEGLAYVTGQLLSDGGTENNSYQQILDALYPMASGYSVRVDKELTTLTGRVHRDNVDAYAGLITDALLRPAFPVADFERVRTDALNYLEKTLRYSSDEELGKSSLYSHVFGGTRYAHPEIGTVEGLRALTLDDVRGFHATHFRRDNVQLGLSGGFDNALVDRLEQELANLGAGEPPSEPELSIAAVERRTVLIVDKPGADASISFGFPIAASRGERDYYALWVANSWLGEHRNSSSHLYQVIREQRGMNYGDYSYIEIFPNGGRRQFPPTNVGRSAQLFEVWIRTLPNEWAHFALRAAVRELEQLVEGGMTREEFDLTRAFLRKYVLHFAETTSARLGYAMDDRYYGIEDGHLARFSRVLDELTLEEVNAAIRRHLADDRLRIAIVTGQAEQLRAALAADAPSPVEYPTAKSEEVLSEDEQISRYALGIAPEAIRVVPVDEMFER